MPRAEVTKPEAANGFTRMPYLVLAAGALAVSTGFVLPAPLSLGMILLGVGAAGVAVWLQLRSASWTGPGRFRASRFVAESAAVPILGLFPLSQARFGPLYTILNVDAAQLLLGVLIGVALAGAALIALPVLARKIVVSLLLLFHLGGVTVAVLSLPPASGQPSWVFGQAWMHIYRQYLQFAYLNNSYRFYSPEPGPPNLLWLRLRYADGSTRWVRFPERRQFTTQLAYQRRIALGEGVGQLHPALPGIPAHTLNAREQAGLQLRIPSPSQLPMVPRHQYRVPQAVARRLTASIVRRAAQIYPSEKDPTSPVESVKVYRVVHNLLTPEQFYSGVSTRDRTLYQPYYQGDFDPEGNLLDPNDPFLYWLVPTLYVPRPGGGHDLVEYIDIQSEDRGM